MSLKQKCWWLFLTAMQAARRRVPLQGANCRVRFRHVLSTQYCISHWIMIKKCKHHLDIPYSRIIWGLSEDNDARRAATITKQQPRLKFFKSKSNFKVKVTRSKIMVPRDRSSHMEYTCAICKPYFFWFESYGQGFFKSRSNFKVKVTRSKTTVPCERSCNKEYTCTIWKPYHF